MTIAAGFYFEGGILLCTDTEMTMGDSLKDYQQKLYFQRFVDASVGCAIIGSVDYAVMAVQEIFRLIKETNQSYEEVRKVIDQTVFGTFHKHIFTHPLARQNQAPYFELLVALWTKSGGLKLLSTCETAITEHDRDVVCKGSGGVLARYLVSKAQAASLGTPAALVLAHIVLSNVRRYVPGCGGNSQFVVLSPNGWISMAAPFFMQTYESVVLELEGSFQRMLLTTGDLSMDEVEFEQRLDRFCQKAREARQAARKNGLDNLAKFLVPMGEYSF